MVYAIKSLLCVSFYLFYYHSRIADEGQTFVNCRNDEKKSNNNNISVKIEITPRNEVLLLKKMRIYSLLFFCWVIKLSFQSFYDRGLARIFGHWAKMTWQIHTFASLFTQIKSNRIWKPILKLKRMKKKLQLYILNG